MVLDDPYKLPFADNSIDAAVSSSCFEHSEMFWLLFLEVIRVLKPNGLFFLNVPSNGSFHRYPVDCWRFFPESGKALVSWAKHNGYSSILLESFVSHQQVNVWNDFVAVYLKDEQFQTDYPERMITGRNDIENATVSNHPDLISFSGATEDLRNLSAMKRKLEKVKKIIES